LATSAGLAQGVAEHLSGEKSQKDQGRIGGGTVGRELGQFAENDGEYDHRQERTDQAPCDADCRLLVAYQDIAPGEKEEEFAIPPQVPPILLPRSTGPNDYFQNFT